MECTCNGPPGPPFHGAPFNLSAAALCPAGHQAYNDRLQPLYEAVTALLPGICESAAFFSCLIDTLR